MIIVAQSLANLISTHSGETGIFDRRVTYTYIYYYACKLSR